MSASELGDSVQGALDEFISSHFTTPPEIVINQGSGTGDGYSSKNCSIKLEGDGKIIDLFVKYAPNREFPKRAFEVMNQTTRIEHKFYGEIYPAMETFQEELDINGPFNNVPKYFKTTIKDHQIPAIFLEDLKIQGYDLRDRKKPIDEQHFALVLTALAKFHAVSFAMKDQNPELFDQLSGSGLGDMFSESFKEFGMAGYVSHAIEELKTHLDPVTDKKIYDCMDALPDNLIEHAANLDKVVDEYAVITQGDCWSNNMMFLYDKETGNPIEIKLVDWQMVRLNSPVLDLAYFFYTIANKEALDNFDNYMELYYSKLSDQITLLASDPEKMYPERVFKEHWKKLSKFGLTFAFWIVRALLFDDDEVPNMTENEEVKIDPTLCCGTIRKEETYRQMMKDLLEHFIDRGFL